MKRKMFFRLTAVCLMAVSVLIACTKDYGSDIKQLQDDMSKLDQRVQGVEDAIRNGAVITDVSPITGGTRVTLSNNKTFDIMNGVDGEDGEDGEDGKDGTVWKIAGPEGQETWWCDYGDGKGFVDSGMPARGPQGFKGDQGDPGKSAYELAAAKDPAVAAMTEEEWIASLQGKDGEDGLDGIYYVPVVEKTDPYYGHWKKVDPNTGVATDTDLLWLPEGTLTAVWDDDAKLLTVHNVEGAEDGIVEISLYNGLSSLAVIPEIWDATIGMPQQTVYSILPSPFEIRRYFGMDNSTTHMKYWSNTPDHGGVTPACLNTYFWCALWHSYLGAKGLTQGTGYTAAWDVNSASFNYWWDDVHVADNGTPYEMVYSTLKAAVKDAIANIKDRIELMADTDEFIRKSPVSALNIKYRVNPAGADISGYQFRMIDRTLEVSTKADGDNYARVAPKIEVEQAAKDQWNATAYLDFIKYWMDMPTEFLIRLYATKVPQAWFYWGQWDGQVPGVPNPNVPNFDPAVRYLDLWFQGINGGNMATSTNLMKAWQEANGITYKTVVALEASKNGRGAEAVVSDYTNVKMEFVYPIWTAYNRRYRYNEGMTSQWHLAPSLLNLRDGGGTFENDYLVEGETYDVASHMRFADCYWGRLEDLGFTVKYDYYVYEAKNTESDHGVWEHWDDVNYDENVCGETQENYGGWDKVTCTPDGKVSVKEDAEEAIGKYVIITADASIKNEATGTWYTGAVHSNATYWNIGKMYDEFIGHYVLLIVPDTSKTLNVVYDLGDLDYLTLAPNPQAQSYKTPAPLAYLDPRPQEGREHEWDDALDMDMEGFNNIYTSAPVMTGTPDVPASFAAQFNRAEDMFTVTINNQVPLGEGHVTYTFTPKDNKYSTVCYTIKWNIVIDWAETEPILHEDYIIYSDAARTELAPTVINPDPATLALTGNNYVAGAWNNHRTESTDLTKVPYVDSIVGVKGKKVGEGWKPQSSIKEHIHDYGQYLDIQPNIKDISMSIDWANTKNSAGENLATTSAKIETNGSSTPTYKYQEIIMLENFKAYEKYRDYLVNITIKLANGTEKIVKAYIVRFINPFKLRVTPIVLHTHREDWCAKRANIQILDAATDEVIYDFQENTIDSRYQTLYPGIFEALQDPSNKPKWALEDPMDPSFGEPDENLKVDETSGWFYWRNLGTTLQTDKDTWYEVTMTLPALADLADKGTITVKAVKNSYVFHSQCDPDNPTPEPGNDSRPVWEVIFN